MENRLLSLYFLWSNISCLIESIGTAFAMVSARNTCHTSHGDFNGETAHSTWGKVKGNQ